MATKSHIIQQAKEVLRLNKSTRKTFIFPILDDEFMHSSFEDKSHTQSLYTENGVRWFTDIEGEKVDLGEYPNFLQA